jgi:type IV pilus assembly protein PilW
MKQLARQQGLTLIELMIAMAIGTFLLLGAVTVYTQGRQNYQTAEGISRVQENLRFAMDVLEPDVRMAGFWGMHNKSNDSEVVATGVTVLCNGNNVSAWALNPNFPVDGVNNITVAGAANVAANCPAFGSGIQLNTDVLEIRRASGEPQPLTDDQVQIESHHEGSRLMADGVRPAGFAGPPSSNTFHAIVNAWYVSRDSNNMVGVPSLRRRTLIGEDMVDEEVIVGVENMQVQFGVDTNGDANIDRYVDPEHAALAGNQIISVRLWFLMRSENEERGYQDGNTYNFPDATLADYTPNDGFRRLMASKTIYLRNFNRNML